MPADLLFEIGTEEIPATFLVRALTAMEELAKAKLDSARLSYERLRVIGTPRRLILLAKGVADQQPDVSERVVGPPVQAAFDKEGKPTNAAIGFAKRNGVEVSELERGPVEGKKGEYVLCTRRESGKPAPEVLPALLTELITALPWPKSMRWGYLEESFVRPVHWLVALFGSEVLPVSFAGISAGKVSRGHRFLAPGPVAAVSDEASYLEALRQAFVIADPDTRRAMINAELMRIAEETGTKVRADEDLLREVSYLCEYPKVVCGSFDPGFLEVPEEVIVSAMRAHQRYFAMQDASGRLANRFATVAGTVTRDLDVVRAGNERVLAARLADARFFFREDQRKPLAEFGKKLSGVVFQAKLGSIGAKVERVVKNARAIAAEVGIDADRVAHAASLCKADLVTHMVYEFPDLQGVMGAHYARLSGEPDEVATAIREHYLPRGAGDVTPATEIGAAVAIADRIDTLVGCFAVGLAPTGSADPYGLRRAALGILAILQDRGWSVPLTSLIDEATTNLMGTAEVLDEHKEEILEFFRMRLRGMLADTIPADCVEAALSAGFTYVPDTRARAVAVAALRRRDDFEPLAAAFKRVANILKSNEDTDRDKVPDPALFAEDAERGLWQAFTSIESRASESLSTGDYTGALGILAELKAPVDRFFDAVLVMDKDERVRLNRLALLGRINATFNRIADFRQLAV